MHFNTAAAFIVLTYSYITIFLFFMDLISTSMQVLGVLNGNTDILGAEAFVKEVGPKAFNPLPPPPPENKSNNKQTKK